MFLYLLEVRTDRSATISKKDLYFIPSIFQRSIRFSHLSWVRKKLMIIFWHHTVTPNLTCSSWALSFVPALFSLAYHAYGLKMSLRMNNSLDSLRCRPLPGNIYIWISLHSFAHPWSVCVYLSLLFIIDYTMINNKTYGWTVENVFRLIQYSDKF